MLCSAGNLTLDKLRLEEICEADTLAKITLILDRLPRKLVVLFGSQIASVKSQTASVSMLGLSAIKLATKEPEGISIEVLRGTLRAVEERYGGSSLDVHKVLHAAEGLLKCADGQYLKAHHSDSRTYAIERYDEDLEHHTI